MWLFTEDLKAMHYGVGIFTPQFGDRLAFIRDDGSWLPLPMTCPCFMPPPATTVDITPGQ